LDPFGSAAEASKNIADKNVAAIIKKEELLIIVVHPFVVIKEHTASIEAR